MTLTMFISFKNEDGLIYERLQKESNKSALLVHLLKDYYNNLNSKNSPNTLEKIQKQKEEQVESKRLSQEKIEDLAKMEKEFLEVNKVDEKTKEYKKQIRLADFKRWLNELFFVEQDELDELAEMYDMEKEDYVLYDWGLKKGLALKG